MIRRSGWAGRLSPAEAARLREDIIRQGPKYDRQSLAKKYGVSTSAINYHRVRLMLPRVRTRRSDGAAALSPEVLAEEVRVLLYFAKHHPGAFMACNPLARFGRLYPELLREAMRCE